MRALLLDRRFLILLALTLGTALAFWTSSRYPALDTKALMAGELNLEDGLSFDAWLRHTEGESVLREVGVTYLNWLHTNRQGMLFGLSLAVLLMSALPLIRARLSPRLNGWGASATGLLLGAPLGVCVNCAAPIAFGLYARGARAELAVAAMISSPVFNVIVVSMLLSLFAWPLVAIKLGLTLAVVLVAVPLLLRLFGEEVWSGASCTAGAAPVTAAGAAPAAGRTDVAAAIAGTGAAAPEGDDGGGTWRWLGASLAGNARYLLVSVVPIMLLAGLLGAVVVTLAPWEALPGAVSGGAWWQVAAAILLLAVIGLLLPVPIAFDVLICAALLSAGVPVKYVAVLLFTLGTFSVYSMMVLWKAGARRVAVSLFVTLALVGALAGVASHFAVRWHAAWQIEHHYALLAGDAVTRHRVAAPEIVTAAAAVPPPPSYRDDPARPGIASMPLAPRDGGTLGRRADAETDGPDPFRMTVLDEAGFLLHETPLIESLTLPFSQLNAIAAGDVDGDHREDIVVGTARGLYLYRNVGGRFVPEALPFQHEISDRIGALGLVDLDNDGRLDLFFNRAGRGSYVSHQRADGFETPRRHLAHAPMIVNAVGFADLDRNGELDIVEGLHSGLGGRRLSGEASRNVLALQRDGEFVGQALPGRPGETLSLLLSDVDGDRLIDLLVGNDFDEPDVYYRGSEGGALIPWMPESVVTTMTTMSIVAADIDNDLRAETYHAQITRNPASPPAIVPELSLAELQARHCGEAGDGRYERHRCESLGIRQLASSGKRSAGCMALPATLRFDCLAHHRYIDLDLRDEPDERALLDRHYPDYAAWLATLQAHAVGEADGPDDDGLAQRGDANLLYTHVPPEDGGAPEERAEAMGIDVAGWSWNAAFADLDGDGWQDLHVANGYYEKRGDTTNVWFRNLGGERFEEATERAGLIDFEPTHSSVFTDIDDDGDPDLITFSALGTLRAYRNEARAERFVQVELDDRLGNRSGIGSEIIVRYGDGLHQRREITASGGYLSQGSARAVFGLGEHRRIEAIEVRWSTGESEVHEGPFETGTRYRIRRLGRGETIDDDFFPRLWPAGG